MADSREVVVEMLWETADPLDALGERFGLGDGESAGRWVAAVLDEHWGVSVGSCERVVISDHNALAWVATPGGRMIAKWSVAHESFPRLRELARLTRWLGERGLPVSAPVPSTDGRAQVEVDGVSMSLQREVPAALLDTADPAQVTAAGAALARLQDALATYPHADRIPREAEPPRPLRERVVGWLDSDAGGAAPAAARDTLGRLVSRAPSDQLPRQLLHLDFRAANVLCSGETVAAVLDFEECRADHRVVELARSAVLLGTRFRDWGPVSPEVRTDFLRGYESVRRLTPAEAGWWDVLVLWFGLAMVPPGEDPTGWAAAATAQARRLAGGPVDRRRGPVSPSSGPRPASRGCRWGREGR